MRRAIGWALACWLVLGLLAAGEASAHDLRPGVLSLAETRRGEYDLRFVPPVDNRGETARVTIAFPPGCVREGDRVSCGGELGGTIEVRGMRGDAMRTIVQLQRLDGARDEWIVSAAEPRATLGVAPPSSWLAWVWIGIEHIVWGLDHLAFVIGLLLVLGVRRGLVLDRRLLLTISAFTLAHSLTLALAVLGVVRVAIPPVEACIAASVLLVAREATHGAPTLIRRLPWLAAAVFGLIHGLGFASALGEVGLPRESVAWSLLWFNAGVEIGQLAVVAVVLLLASFVRQFVTDRSAVGRGVHYAASYLLGGFSAWWLADRTFALW